MDYEIAEIKLIQEGSKSSTTAFKGVILSVPSNKTIKANTIIATKRDMNIRNYPTGIIMLIIISVPLLLCECFLSLQFSSNIDLFINLIMLIIITLIIILITICNFIEKQKSMQTVKLESVNFDKRFNVFSKNQVEARYLLTPTFIEKFTRLYTAFGTNKAKCSFTKTLAEMTELCLQFLLGKTYSNREIYLRRLINLKTYSYRILHLF